MQNLLRHFYIFIEIFFLSCFEKLIEIIATTQKNSKKKIKLKKQKSSRVGDHNISKHFLVLRLASFYGKF